MKREAFIRRSGLGITGDTLPAFRHSNTKNSLQFDLHVESAVTPQRVAWELYLY